MRYVQVNISRLLYRAMPASAALVICSCGTTSGIGRPSELVVHGRLENLSAESTIDDPNDLIGHGWFSARLHVSRVLSGRLDAPAIPVRYFAHTYLRENQSRPLKLYRDPEGNYLICARPGESGFNCPSDRHGR